MSGGLRWQRSIYLDSTAREIVVPFAEMTPVEAPPGTRPDLSKVDTLLIVVDTVNSAPGSAGECRIDRLLAERSRAASTSAP